MWEFEEAEINETSFLDIPELWLPALPRRLWAPYPYFPANGSSAVTVAHMGSSLAGVGGRHEYLYVGFSDSQNPRVMGITEAPTEVSKETLEVRQMFASGMEPLQKAPHCV